MPIHIIYMYYKYKHKIKTYNYILFNRITFIYSNMIARHHL